MAEDIETRSDPALAIQRLWAMADTDPQIRGLVPDEAVTRSVRVPGLSYQEVIARTLAGYAERPAMGERSYDIRREASGCNVRHYLPAFTTITYGELARDIEAIANAWLRHPQFRLAPGEFVCHIAFTGAEMVAMDLACTYAQAISVPIQANLPAPELMGIFGDVDPSMLVASIDNLELAVGYALQLPSVRGLIIIDADLAVDSERERIEEARQKLRDERGLALATFREIVDYGSQFEWTPLPHAPEGLDAMVMVMFTSGSTGTPKGAMVHEAMCIQQWTGVETPLPTVHLAYAPMNHFMGRGSVFGTLGQGGTVYFTLKSDMSTLLEDIRIARPTTMGFMPRITEIVYQHYRSEVQRRVADGLNPDDADAAVRLDMREGYLGDRLVMGGVGSAPTAPEVQAFIRDCFELAFTDAYGNTEGGPAPLISGGHIQRNVVIDYKLIDVPELGYYTTDTPYPRGEFLVKSRIAIKGYFRRPEATAAVFDQEGWLHTGDILEQRGPDQFVWIDRRNNVIKLSQAEFVAISPLEATYLAHSPLIRQIYLYGSSYRSFLLAVVVPDLEIARARLGHDPVLGELRAEVLADMQKAARNAGLKSFEVPRDVLIELEPFTYENGLLSSLRKPLRPKLRAYYEDRLEAIYQDIERQQEEELVRLRRAGGLSTLDRVAGALKASLGLAAIDPESTQSFTDLGGDSLGAVSLSLLLEEMFGVLTPVSVILNPAGSARRIAQHIDNAFAAGNGPKTPTFASVHGSDAANVKASDLKLHAFFDAEALAAAAEADPPAAETRTVLLTGATGFLGRFLCLEWLEKMAAVRGKVVCLVRAADAASARQRLDEGFGAADPELADRFRRLAEASLEVVAGDLATPGLGLGDADFARLAEEVDQIVHPGALVNHRLTYQNLFEPNVAGTAELIRLALTARRKRFDYVSTVGVPHMSAGLTGRPEALDVRIGAPELPIGDSYAVGYGVSKWAGEVLLREAHEQFGLPVTVYRPDMILAHSRYHGQINVPDLFTRLLFSLVVTGVAPGSFYDAHGCRPRTHYDGTPVDFLAAAMQQLGASPHESFRTFNTISAHHDDGVSLDTITDWVASAGYPIQRIRDHADWVRRVTDKMRSLPDEQRRHSLEAIMGYFDHPHPPHPPAVRNDGFVAAVREVPAGPDTPHLTEAFIHKYLDDMRLLGLLRPAAEI